jgi:hypothetical protein
MPRHGRFELVLGMRRTFVAVDDSDSDNDRDLMSLFVDTVIAKQLKRVAILVAFSFSNFHHARSDVFAS